MEIFLQGSCSQRFVVVGTDIAVSGTRRHGHLSMSYLVSAYYNCYLLSSCFVCRKKESSQQSCDRPEHLDLETYPGLRFWANSTRCMHLPSSLLAQLLRTAECAWHNDLFFCVPVVLLQGQCPRRRASSDLLAVVCTS